MRYVPSGARTGAGLWLVNASQYDVLLFGLSARPRGVYGPSGRAAVACTTTLFVSQPPPDSMSLIERAAWWDQWVTQSVRWRSAATPQWSEATGCSPAGRPKRRAVIGLPLGRRRGQPTRM